LINLLRKIK